MDEYACEVLSFVSSTMIFVSGVVWLAVICGFIAAYIMIRFMDVDKLLLHKDKPKESEEVTERDG